MKGKREKHNLNQRPFHFNFPYCSFGMLIVSLITYFLCTVKCLVMITNTLGVHLTTYVHHWACLYLAPVRNYGQLKKCKKNKK